MTAAPHQRLIDALTANGWKVVGGRSGLYVRLTPPGTRLWGNSALVPVDQTAADYNDLIGALLAQLRATAEQGARAADILAAYDGTPPTISPVARDVLSLLAADGGRTLHEIAARATSLLHNQIIEALAELKDAGAIEFADIYRNDLAVWQPTDKAAKLLESDNPND
jgi:hypothetical protein